MRGKPDLNTVRPIRRDKLRSDKTRGRNTDRTVPTSFVPDSPE